MQRFTAGQQRELASHFVSKLVVVQVAGRGEDHVATVKPVAVIGKQLLPVEPGDGLRGAQDGPAQRVVLPEALREQLVDQQVGVVLVHLDLFQNHAALALDVGVGENRVEDQVGEHVQGDGHVVSQRLDVEADGFLAGEGVQVAADRIHLAGNVLGGAGTGALEEHVLHKVGDAAGLGQFAPRAGLDPHAHGHRAQVIHALGQQDQAVRQYGAAKVSLSGRHHQFDSIVGQLGATGTLPAVLPRSSNGLDLDQAPPRG